MNNSETVSVLGREEKIFQFFLLLYPIEYRKKFGKEMQILFRDQCQEELQRNGTIRLEFWFSQLVDIGLSIFREHYDELHTRGLKNYLKNTLHLHRYNIIGALLLLPFTTLFSIDIIARIVQRDLLHYNRPVYQFLSHTPLYSVPVLISMFFVFPGIAVFINTIPFLKTLQKDHWDILKFSFLKQNSISLFILFAGLGVLAFVPLHDAIPCAFNGILKLGFGQIFHIIAICRDA